MTDSTFDAHPKLPVFAIAKQSLCFLAMQWRLMALPFIALVLFNLLTMHLTFRYTMAMNPLMPQVISIALLLVEASFIVGVHRTILLDERRTGITFYRADSNWLRYIVTGFLIGLIFVGLAALCIIPLEIGVFISLPRDVLDQVMRMPPRPDMLSALSAGILDHGHTGLFAALAVLGLVFFAIALFIGARLSLAFPAAALGQSKSIGLSWHLARGRAWRLCAICLLSAWLPLMLASLLQIPIDYLALYVAPPRLIIIAESWGALAHAFCVVSWAAGLSLSYQILSGNIRRSA